MQHRREDETLITLATYSIQQIMVDDQSQIAQNPRPARKINIRTSVQNASASMNV